MGANAAAHAATFSWDNTAAATLQAYRSGAHEPRPCSQPEAFGVLRVLDSQGRRDMLQSLPLGLDAKNGLDQAAGDHEGGTDEVAKSDLGNVPRPGGVLDQGAEEQRPSDAASSGTDRIEEGDAQRPGLSGKISLTVR